jgi:diguanylate cyclase (GGDEF)-like protein/PAS domain S-box-containing protein
VERGEEMDLNEKSCRTIIDNLYDGLNFVDRDRIIRYWNKGAERISGFPAGEVIGRSCADNILTHVDKEGNNLCLAMCPLASTLTDGEHRTAEVYLHHKSGYRVPVSVRVATLTDEQDRMIGGVEIFSDVSAYKSMELRTKELEELALLDNLTRLANRRCVEKELLMRFDEEKRFGLLFGLLMMDIDHFKKFNDRFGHDVGDRVLKLVAETLAKNARPFDLIGRWGGEEFIGVVRNITAAQLKDIGERMRMLVANSYLIQDGEKLKVTISLGGTLLIPGDTVETLIKRADNLLYKSKHAGRNRLTVG